MEPILRTIEHKDWATIIILVSILFLVIAKSLFYGRFMNFIMLPFNNRYIFMYNKKDRLQNWFHIFFTLFMILNFSLFIFFARNILVGNHITDAPLLYLVVLASLLLFLVVKVLLQLSNGFIFGTSKTINEIIFKKLSYLNYSSLVVLLANILLTYVLSDSKFIVYTSIFLVLSINTIGWVTLVKNHQKFITNYFFYFILYLCTLEFAPIVIIGSYLKD